MKIGIDLDEVLADFMPQLLKYYNGKYKTNFTRKQIKEYNFWNLWRCTKEQVIEEVYHFFKSPYANEIQPVRGARETVLKLNKNNELFVITSRADDFAEETFRWINKYFSRVFSEIYITNQWNNSYKKTKKKSDICKELGIELIIEDGPEHASDCASSGLNVLLFDCPWNKGIIGKKIKRIKSWDEALKEIRKINSKNT